ncbi:MAG TPA: M1 family aminopeptidase, partial [Roseiflexaceae bacterium]
NDFGSYDVSITTPKAYIVAGGGTPKGAAAEQASFATVRYTADDVTDFAFAASPDFKTRTGKSGDVDVVLYYLPEHEASVAEYMGTSIESLQDYSAWYGAYPHSRLTVVDVPDDASGAGGMEYPTLVTGGTFGQPAGSGFVALVVSHEIGHQWWPMQTATNEGRAPWLDEGLTEYSGMRYLIETGTQIGLGGVGVSAAVVDKAACASSMNRPATLPAWQYTRGTYITVYCKTALGLWTLESVIGTSSFRKAMADYLAQYRFKHPTGADFRASLERSLGGDLGWFFNDYLNGIGVIDYTAGPIENITNGSTVRVIRKGAVRAPVEVRVTLASGAQHVESWDGLAQETSFTFPGDDAVARVEVDPAHKLKAELNVLDNSVSTAPQISPAITLGGRLAFLLQAIAQTIGLFG